MNKSFLGKTDFRNREIKNTALLTVLGACLLVTMIMPSKAEASQCKSKVSAYSYSVTKSLARKQARIAWRAYVVRKHGVPYAVWRLGKNRSSSCKRKWNGSIRCTVRANPCR